MTARRLVIFFVAVALAETLGAQVSPDRILNAQKEPQNWLTYSGSYLSQRYSQLTQITPTNAKDLVLKWVFQARWLDYNQATPLVVDGVMYTTQGNDVVALDATTGKMFWIFPYTPASDARFCCGRITRGLAIHGDTLFLGPVPLVPISNSRFLLGPNPMEFVKDKEGRVTHFAATFVEGDLIGRRVAERKIGRAHV